MLGCPCRRGTDACAGARGPVCPWGEFPCDCLCRPCCSQTSFLWTRDSRVLPSLSSPSRCFCLPGSRAPVRSRVAGPACLPPESSTSRWGRGGGGDSDAGGLTLWLVGTGPALRGFPTVPGPASSVVSAWAPAGGSCTGRRRVTRASGTLCGLSPGPPRALSVAPAFWLCETLAPPVLSRCNLGTF